MQDSWSSLGLAVDQGGQAPWYRQLNRYHWFVLTVCTLGWVFDCMGQQLFAVVRKPAVAALIGAAADDPDVDWYSGLATSLMLIGWATGGIIFGILGDRIGRARTMVFTILIYSIFTGVSGIAQNLGEFILYRFLCGLGVGGQFAVGATLIAESMPEGARPRALALMQALANWGNVTAALIGMGFGQLEKISVVSEGWQWRWTLAVGALPALLAIPVFRRLKEPESWRRAVGAGERNPKAGSLKELFGNPRWRRNTIVGMILASTGVIGLWGIGFFSIDLNQTIFLNIYENKERKLGEAEKDRELISLILRSPQEAAEFVTKIPARRILNEKVDQREARCVYGAITELYESNQQITRENIISLVEKIQPLPDAPARLQHDRLVAYLTPSAADLKLSFQEHVDRITARAKTIRAGVSFWGSITSVLFNIGGFFGAYAFSYITARLGRRPAFALAFLLAGSSTCFAFLYMQNAFDVFWMTPLMGFCQFLIFGGYAIYFPELYPTRLRSTGTSFCYNIGRYVAAIGPSTLGMLCFVVFRDFQEPMRYAGATMCAIFLLGLLVLPFAPETRGKPLPE